MLAMALVSSARALLPVRAELALLCPAGLAAGVFSWGTDLSLCPLASPRSSPSLRAAGLHLGCRVQTEASRGQGGGAHRCSETGEHSWSQGTGQRQPEHPGNEG